MKIHHPIESLLPQPSVIVMLAVYSVSFILYSIGGTIKYAPFIGFSFGFCAVAIAIQHIYIHSTDIFDPIKK